MLRIFLTNLGVGASRQNEVVVPTLIVTFASSGPMTFGTIKVSKQHRTGGTLLFTV